ncbi:hypothetical protein OE88DRAFT_1665285 [Heliocybe sulcata]|uniref:Uncharacterized protein n=1 Tax=Heliocybe sulcata TaxID=5364 RepID=A0A5C3MV86_9AGAM|nr:hypothetical protein OE88DRAFT_1665285 [Heliocybe sulcata]
MNQENQERISPFLIKSHVPSSMFPVSIFIGLLVGAHSGSFFKCIGIPCSRLPALM